MKAIIKQKLFDILTPLVASWNIDLNQQLEVINNINKDVLKFGHYSTNLPLKLSKIINQNPLEIAKQIETELNKNSLSFFTKIEVQFPGFINLFVSKDFIFDNFIKFDNSNYKPEFKSTPKYNLNYEYVSANPTGWLHLGHARNAFVGDIVTNLFAYTGSKVFLEYYINDFGVQIDNLTKSVIYYYNVLTNQPQTLEQPLYQGKEIKEYADEFYHVYGDTYSLDSVENFKFIKQTSLKHFLNEIEKTLNLLKIKKFNIFTSEADLYNSKKVDDAIVELQKNNALYVKDNATWLRSSLKGDDKDRVVIKENGEFTYLTADIANHINKLKKGFNKLINLWGKDHHGYEKRMKASLEFLSYDADILEIDYINMVQVTNLGETIKMSKRAGTSITINEILNEIEPDILRYFMVSKTKDQGLEIDLSEIKNQSNANPYFYLQYANARSNQVLEKYFPNEIKMLKKLTKANTDKDIELLLKVLEFEEIIESSIRNREPSILLNYSKELASVFHSFYNSNKIISDNIIMTQERILIISIFKKVLKNVFDLLGISPLNKM